tara:strand:+ start:837 stop:1169 length:333 start_codon:yes stop_codon:yes gene_type:complete
MKFEPENIYPKLIEPGVKYFLERSLKNAHIYKVEFYNTIFNIILFVVFCLSVVCFFGYKYKGKLSQEEVEKKDHESHQYVLKQIKKFQVATLKSEQSLITGLPHWENAYQ